MKYTSRLTLVSLTFGAFLAVTPTTAGGDKPCPESPKVTMHASAVSMYSNTSGFSGKQFFEINGKQAALFGLHKLPGGKMRYTYLVLFKPNHPKGELRHGGGGSTNVNGDALDCEINVMAGIGENPKVELQYKLKTDGKEVTSESWTIDGKEYGKDGPRVFLVDATGEKVKCLPIKVTPDTVPDFADDDEEAWAKQILKAIKELQERSAEAKEFFRGKN